MGSAGGSEEESKEVKKKTHPELMSGPCCETLQFKHFLSITGQFCTGHAVAGKRYELLKCHWLHLTRAQKRSHGKATHWEGDRL